MAFCPGFEKKFAPESAKRGLSPDFIPAPL